MKRPVTFLIFNILSIEYEYVVLFFVYHGNKVFGFSVFFVRIIMLHANTWDPRPVIGGKTCQKAVNELVTVTGTVLVVKSAKVAETSVIQHKMV